MRSFLTRKDALLAWKHSRSVGLSDPRRPGAAEGSTSPAERYQTCCLWPRTEFYTEPSRAGPLACLSSAQGNNDVRKGPPLEQPARKQHSGLVASIRAMVYTERISSKVVPGRTETGARLLAIG